MDMKGLVNKKMTTAEMISEALKDGETYVSQDYCSGGLWYSAKKGFCYDNGYSLKEIEYFEYFMTRAKWTKIGATVMSK